MKVKGANIRPMIEWFAATCGEDSLREVGQALPAVLGTEIRVDAPALGVLPAGWYTERLASELADVFVRRVSGVLPLDAALRAIGDVIIDRSLGRISRAAVEWLASPALIARSATRFWGMYHDSGTVTARLDGDAIYATNESWCDHGIMWCRVVGASCRRTLEIAGCTGARVAVHRCGGGPKPCSMVFRW